MGVSAILGSLIPAVASLFGKVIDKAVPDKEQAAKIKAAAQQHLHDLAEQELAGAIKIILAEANGNWLQRSWRPGLMCIFGFIIANNYIIAPYMGAIFGAKIMLPLPPQMWDLLKIGIGGYITSRGVEKGISIYKGNAGVGG